MAAREHMREYETIYIMRPELDDKAAKDLMLAKKELIERLGGKNLKVTAMGRRKLSWETQKETRGIFVHHHFLGKPGIVKDFDRALSIDDNVLIRQSVVLKHDVNPELAKVEEDSLVPPVFKERREYSDRRGRFGDRGEGGDYDRRSRGFGMDDEDEEDDMFGDEN
ncbi:MAG TPA: 30S ribosomal protein S6 [Myxococcota bacterium]|nr:30S ribosomal protein S6 [Myxococcota bacterium]